MTGHYLKSPILNVSLAKNKKPGQSNNAFPGLRFGRSFKKRLSLFWLKRLCL